MSKIKKISLTDILEFSEACSVINKFKNIHNEVDLTALFKKQPTKKQLKQFIFTTENLSKGSLQSLILLGEFWGREWSIELTDGYKKFLKNSKQVK